MTYETQHQQQTIEKIRLISESLHQITKENEIPFILSFGTLEGKADVRVSAPPEFVAGITLHLFKLLGPEEALEVMKGMIKHAQNKANESRPGIFT